MGALASKIQESAEVRLDRSSPEVDLGELVEKEKIHVSGYTQTRGGRVVHVSAYNRKSLLSAVRALVPGKSVELPDGRRIAMNRNGSLSVVAKPGSSRGRRTDDPKEAVDRVRAASARDHRDMSSYGGAQGHATTRAADRADAKAHEAAKLEDSRRAAARVNAREDDAALHQGAVTDRKISTFIDAQTDLRTKNKFYRAYRKWTQTGDATSLKRTIKRHISYLKSLAPAFRSEWDRITREVHDLEEVLRRLDGGTW